MNDFNRISLIALFLQFVCLIMQVVTDSMIFLPIGLSFMCIVLLSSHVNRRIMKEERGEVEDV